MIRKQKTSAILVVMGIVAALTLSSCGLFVVLLSPIGKVVDARTGNPVSDATVNFHAVAVQTGQSQLDVQGTTDSNGTFLMAGNVMAGRYEITVTKSGYVFFPVVRDVGGWASDVGSLYGVQPDKDDDVSIVLVWNSTQKDLDSYLTYPTTWDTILTDPGTYEPYAEIVAGGRTKVAYNNKQDENDVASLDVDDTDYNGPETVSFHGSNLASAGAGDAVSNPELSGLTGNYEYIGAAAYYVHSYDGVISSSTSISNGAEATVYVTQGTDIKGVYTFPGYLSVETAQVLRLNTFVTASAWYVSIIPEIKLVNGAGNIKSLGDDVAHNESIVLSGSR
jgi:hypothetical protein